MRTGPVPRLVGLEISRFPYKERACMPGSATTPGRPSACDCALRRVAFRYTDSVGTQKQFSIAAQWLACTYPCRRFADILANACARLGADVVRYSFIAGDLHPLTPCRSPGAPVWKRQICVINAMSARSEAFGIAAAALCATAEAD